MNISSSLQSRILHNGLNNETWILDDLLFSSRLIVGIETWQNSAIASWVRFLSFLSSLTLFFMVFVCKTTLYI
ncbi:hypothetical protein PN497_20070 [Sphaerospermopsis kisseleviana CS-549]|uniref:Uncharacterized protein n=1 Tax=Sphaerospermopsis kisseleviana CS-549 TaxID=3021783 RepID=A0ABT4ZWH9_9CYAN|nr:hypothetical protein [Sphaerospermopsis kisseleviana]MDB9443629.1 hypothetical protein [Sphaerospermopsis kisseleviana CS-549]BAZ81081.1 hypothetical protein NIES73_23470 [Sphaerospermopsis kisseleviana NIES-73]